MKDITGKKYGKLTVLGVSGKSKEGRLRWNCSCDCGGGGDYYKNNLDSGRSHCGCDANTKPNLKHGLRNHPLYSIWIAMKSRCANPENQDYANYGGRGISVCKEWESSLQQFIADMGERPEGFSLDRIDVNLGYSPDNCRWADWNTQMDNRRVTVRVEGGESIKSVSDRTGVSRHTLYMREYRKKIRGNN